MNAGGPTFPAARPALPASGPASPTLGNHAVAAILRNVDQSRSELVELTQRLIRLPSETPPSDTRAAAQFVMDLLADLENAETSLHPSVAPVTNLVAIARGDRPGKRLVLNGHLDTYPAGDVAAWTDAPFSGAVRDDCIFGRGAADMKGGIVCSLKAFSLLASNPHLWSGELVLALAGDEESMGTLGTKFLLDTVPQARGDAMICGDVGSPLVPRIGEKGMIWIDVFATGKPAHGAHVHRGVNAIDALRKAMDALASLAHYPVAAPPEVTRVIKAATPVSEPMNGDGETEVLGRVTVNFGRIAGGQTANLVADHAEVNADIRLPMGTSVADVETEIERVLAPLNGIRFEITRRYDPTWTDPDDPVVDAVTQACRAVLGQEPAINMRVGASDARLYRAARIPTIVCGLTPNNLGAPDEFVEIDELVAVAKIHTLAALTFLAPD